MGTGQHGMPMQPGMPMGPMGDMSSMNDMSMMSSLWKLPPNRLEVVFLSQMIPHHQGAIDMANLMPDRAAHQELKELGKRIVQSQVDETVRLFRAARPHAQRGVRRPDPGGRARQRSTRASGRTSGDHVEQSKSASASGAAGAAPQA
jgi:hypothetical protein